MNFFSEEDINTKYSFFTGKGGVGKTSIACSSAIRFSEKGEKVLLISTDPASNLQDVFGMELNSSAKQSTRYPNLSLINLDPEVAAKEYKDSVILPYKGLLPEEALKNMEEQLSGSCTTEIAAFNEFTGILTNKELSKNFDRIIFDTAPTGHTLRMLQLPSAWNSFIEESTHGASCLGQLSGLEDDKDKYAESVSVLCDGDKTTLILVSRPDITPMAEAERASQELREIGIDNQVLVINGVMESFDDEMSRTIFNNQQEVLNNLSDYLKKMKKYKVSLKSSSIYTSESLSKLFDEKDDILIEQSSELPVVSELVDFVDHVVESNKRIVFTMGKGGVGKTSIASAIATEIASRGLKVILTTTDPANHLKYVVEESDNLTIKEIDENKVLEKYKDEVIFEAKKTMGDNDLDYIEEDLRSPCTQEIAVFKEFAEIVDLSDNEIVVIDTAPTGHTLLLLESTESYNKEVSRSSEVTQNAISRLLPKLKNPAITEVAIVSLAEATPYYEAERLEQDLMRAEIYTKWWLVNNSLAKYEELSTFLTSKKNNEINWINKIAENENRNVAVINWNRNGINKNTLRELLKNEI